MLPPSDVSSQGVRLKPWSFWKTNSQLSICCWQCHWHMVLPESPTIASNWWMPTKQIWWKNKVNVQQLACVSGSGPKDLKPFKIYKILRVDCIFMVLRSGAKALWTLLGHSCCLRLINRQQPQFLAHTGPEMSQSHSGTRWLQKMFYETLLLSNGVWSTGLLPHHGASQSSCLQMLTLRIGPGSLQSFLEISPCCLDTWWSRPLQQHLKGLDPANREVFFQELWHVSMQVCGQSLWGRSKVMLFKGRLQEGCMQLPWLPTSNVLPAWFKLSRKILNCVGDETWTSLCPKSSKHSRINQKKKGVSQTKSDWQRYVLLHCTEAETRGQQEQLHFDPGVERIATKYPWMVDGKVQDPSQHQAKSRVRCKGFCSRARSWGSFYEYFMGRWQCRLPIHPDSFRAFLRNTKGKELLWKHCKLLLTLQTLGQQRLKSTSKRFQLGKSHIISRQLWDWCAIMHLALPWMAMRSGECQLAREIMATHKLPNGCFSDHAGLCLTVHAEELNGIKQFMKAIPRKSCVLRFTVGRLVLHARAVLGQTFRSVDFTSSSMNNNNNVNVNIRWIVAAISQLFAVWQSP